MQECVDVGETIGNRSALTEEQGSIVYGLIFRAQYERCKKRADIRSFLISGHINGKSLNLSGGFCMENIMCNAMPQENYTMRITYMCHQNPCTVIDIDFLNRRIRIKNCID